MTSNPNSRLRHPLTWLLPLLVIALVALVLPSVAHGQGTASTPVTLVSNQGQAGDASATYDKDHGQAFTTGSETNGYTVTSVTIRSEDPNDDPIPLQICEVDESTHPTADCWDLTGPSVYLENTLINYTARTSPALTLEANTTYMVVFKAPPSGDLLRVDATTSAGEDSALAGWSIRDKFQWNNGGTWQDASRSRALRITITGTVTPPPPPLASNIGQSDGTTGLTQLFDFAQPFSTGNHDEGYTLEDISIRLHTSSTATVAPVLTLHSGSGTGTKVADFNGPSALTGGTVKNYEYTPTTPVTLEMSTEYWVVVDQGRAGVSVQFTASDSEDGTPVDGASIGNAAHSRGAGSTGSFSQHSGTTPSLMIKVNGSARPTPPTVSSVAITSNPGMDNTYATGDTITVSLTFSEAVTVTGTPHVVVDIGGQPRNFKYSGDGSSAAAQPFGYTVFAGDRDLDGVSLLANSLTLNGGTIQATDDSTNATLAHSAMAFANHKVDTNVTLVSNIGQTDATDTITVSETESATASFTIESRDRWKGYTLKEIVLDVKTASDMLDVTITVSLDIDPSANYVFSGSVATTGRQVFSLDDPFQQLAQIYYDDVTYELTISGTGSGTVEIGATASSGQDSGGLSWWGVADPPSGKSIPRFKLHGYEDTNPFIYHAEIISSPDDGTTYRAGERIDVLVLLTERLQGPVPAEAEIWLGTQAQHRRAASFVSENAILQSFGASSRFVTFAVYAYTVQTGDRDTDGILLGENPLGRNTNADLRSLSGGMPADLTYEAIQLGSKQLVDGSQAGLCAEIICAEILPARSFNPLQAGEESTTWAFDLQSPLEDGGTVYPPWDERGESSRVTFRYGAEEHSILLIILVHPHTFITWCGPGACPILHEPFLSVILYPDISAAAVERLGFVVDGSVLHLTEADSGSGGTSFWWTNPGVTLADGQAVSVKLVENATATFDAASYTKTEGDSFDVTVTLGDSFTENTITLPIEVTGNGGATEADYSINPEALVFLPGETEKTFSVTVVDDDFDDDDESFIISFGEESHIKSGGTHEEVTVTITDNDDCGDIDIWCGTVEFGATVHWEGRYDLHATDVDNREFSYNGADYRLLGVAVPQNGHDSGDDNHVVLPFGIPERTHFLIDFLNLSGPSDQVFDPPNNDWLDWTLHVSTVSDGETLTATLRFSEARKLAGAWWRWSGGDIDDLRRAWKTDQLYKLRLVEDPRSERTPQPLNPPLYLSVQGEVNTTQTWLRWLTPQTRHDRVPPVDSYRIQWKQSSGSWDTASDVSETTRGPSRQRPVSHYLDGLTRGVEYNIRVIATDSAGDSEPSNEVTYTKPAEAQLSLSNTPAEGEPRIDGIPEVGQTLSADTTGIVDVDGLDDVIFQYQWLAGDADIAGGTGPTYTVVSGDVGRAIRVRVAFTDDGGNEETLTSAPTVATAAGLQLRSATVDLGMLTLTYSKELDTGVSLETAPFAVNVNGSSRSLSGVAVGQFSVLLLLSQPVEAGDMVTVDYTVPDGQNFIRDTLGRKAASFSRQAVTNSTAEDQEDAARGTEDADTEPEYPSAVVEPPLTATVHDVPSSHNGQDAFTFELRFSEDPKPDFSYTTVRDHAFTVAGGSVTYVRRLNPPSNIGWEVHVTPDGNGDVNLSLRSTTDCSAQGAICTGEGRKLSGGLQLAVAGPNTPATGAPTISGTAQVGETLTADTTGISDTDGLTNTAFTYQWLAGDAEINGATASTYTLADDDAGKAIRVRVTFTDDAGNDEELTSAATGAVAAAPPNTPATGAPTISGTLQVGETLTAGTTDISDGDGLGNAVFAYQWLADDSNISGATDSTYTLVAADAGKTIRVRVSFTDDAGNNEELTSVATGAVAPKPNTPATGAPTISGTARVSETLTASTTDISDADGMTSATFSYQWLADDSNISGATDSTYTLVAADAGKTIRVRVSFTDDGENGEELASAATSAVAAEVVNPPLTASARNVPSSHDGSAAFTFELRFSDELPLSYVTLRDHVFTVTGGSVTYVRRLAPPSNMRWEVHVTPDSDGSLVIVLPVTGDCEADGAICTEDGRRLSNRLEVTVNGP